MRADAAARAGITRYTLPLRLLHAVLALLIVAQLALGWIAEHAVGPVRSQALLLVHMQLGVLILLGTVLRLAWRCATPVPAAAAGSTRWQRVIRGLVHALLYIGVLALVASGYVIWIWMGGERQLLGPITLPVWFTPPADDETGRAIAWYVHVWGAWVLLGLILLHAGAALVHSLQHPQARVLQRMGFQKRNTPEIE